MIKGDKKRIITALICSCVFLTILITSCIKSGIGKGNIMLRFNEHETVTFFSSFFLGLTSLLSLIIFLIKKRLPKINNDYYYWLLSSIGFFYLAMDDYFMAHEGMDEWVGSWFGMDVKSLGLDGAVIGFFGVLAAGALWIFRKEILMHKVMHPFLILGGFFLACTVFLDQVEKFHIYYEVAEECAKIIGVLMFHCAYWVTFLSLFSQLNISLPNND